jgi:hypothetical protein
VGGITNLAKWIRFYKAHEIPVYAIFDTDSAKTGQNAEEAQKARLDTFRALELDAQRDWDHYVTGPVGVHERFAVFDADFEVALRSSFGDEYQTLEATAKETLGKAKPLIARSVARQLAAPPPGNPSGWDVLRPLAAQVLALAQ